MPIDQGGPKRHALGVDFGTSNTVAVARWPDGRARPILVDGSPLLPSAVCAEPDGTLLVGRDAVHSARIDPARFEPNPKRRIDDGLVLLGDHELPVVDLIAAVLARVAEEWHRAVGQVKPDVTLTCPATWGATRRTLLAEAAARAGLTGARLVAEPVAAATYFAEVLGRDVPIGSVVVVHDFGAGTFDASVVARTSSGFEVMAVDGRDDIGGLDIDAAIVEHLRTDAWQRLLEPSTVEERRAQRQLWDDVRIAKERLSRTQAADFVVPLLDTEAHLTRDELERVARPVLDQTVRVTKGLLRWADLPAGRLAGVFLVGGASRIPLVATLLHRELGEAPVVIEQPELVVAEGSILADAALLATGAAAPGPTAELRLVSTGRAETPTVRVSAMPVRIPGTTGLQPPVDPWPDAEHGPWPPPDPHATVATSTPPFGAPPVERVSPPTPPPARARAVPPSKPAPPPTPPPARARAVPPSKPAPPPSETRPLSPAMPPARPVSSPPQAVRRPPAPTVRRPKRRTGRFLRSLQILLSILVMVVVPLTALLVAYGYGNGESLEVNARNLVDDIRDLLGI
jgi:molecular chaperone DnaK